MEKTTVDADNMSYKPTIDELIKKYKTEDQVWPPKKTVIFFQKIVDYIDKLFMRCSFPVNNYSC